VSALDDALNVQHALVLESGARWGDVAAPFQRADAEANLDPASPTPYSFQTRSRGGSKTDDLGGVSIAVMLAQGPPGARLYGVAADRDQARLLLDSISGFHHRTPELRGALEVGAYRVAAPRRDVVLEILAPTPRSRSGARTTCVTGGSPSCTPRTGRGPRSASSSASGTWP
jgi:hypothetical protein